MDPSYTIDAYFSLQSDASPALVERFVECFREVWAKLPDHVKVSLKNHWAGMTLFYLPTDPSVPVGRRRSVAQCDRPVLELLEMLPAPVFSFDAGGGRYLAWSVPVVALMDDRRLSGFIGENLAAAFRHASKRRMIEEEYKRMARDLFSADLDDLVAWFEEHDLELRHIVDRQRNALKESHPNALPQKLAIQDPSALEIQFHISSLIPNPGPPAPDDDNWADVEAAENTADETVIDEEVLQFTIECDTTLPFSHTGSLEAAKHAVQAFNGALAVCPPTALCDNMTLEGVTAVPLNKETRQALEAAFRLDVITRSVVGLVRSSHPERFLFLENGWAAQVPVEEMRQSLAKPENHRWREGKYRCKLRTALLSISVGIVPDFYSGLYGDQGSWSEMTCLRLPGGPYIPK